MQTITFSDARNQLKRVLDRVAEDADYTVIIRRGAEAAAVMSLASFNSLLERPCICCAPRRMPRISPAPSPSTALERPTSMA